MDAITTSLLRAQAVNFALTDTCTIMNQTESTDAAGNIVSSWVQLATGVKCRLIRSNRGSASTNQISADAQDMREEYRLALPYDNLVRPHMQVIINSLTYDVVRIDQDMTHSFFVHFILSRHANG